MYFSCLFFCSTLFEFIKLNITLCQQSYHDLVSSPHHRQTKFYLSARTLVSKYRTPLLNIGLSYFNIEIQIFFPNLEYCVGGRGGRVAVGACQGQQEGSTFDSFGGSHKNTSKLHCYCLKFCRLLYNLMLFWKPLLLLVILEQMAMVYSETKPNIKFRMRSACSPVLCDFC